jgi:phospholipid transport system substrate-binding protein
MSQQSTSVFGSIAKLFASARTLVTPERLLSRRWLLSAAILLPLLGMVTLTRAQDATPAAAVKLVVNNILGVLRKPDFSFEKDRPAISAEIKRAFDDLAMAQSVLATNWKNVAPAKQGEFKGLLLQTIESTYIGRIKVYTNETVEFRGEEIKENRATVKTVILSSSGEIPVTYKLRKRTDGWFIYDVEVENVSMVNSFRDTYRAIYGKDGIDGLLQQMRAKITELER